MHGAVSKAGALRELRHRSRSLALNPITELHSRTL
jgi:hypothetical protein